MLAALGTVLASMLSASRVTLEEVARWAATAMQSVAAAQVAVVIGVAASAVVAPAQVERCTVHPTPHTGGRGGVHRRKGASSG